MSAGESLALTAALLFTVNVIRLFRQPASARPALPLPYPDQTGVDRIAIQFTRMSGFYLLIGLAVGVVLAIDAPDTGRWDLVWAHALLIGFLMSMIAGVSYHVLTRWTDRRWRSVRAIRLHFALVAIGLPLMLLALAFDWRSLFKIAGPLQALALLLFLVNVLPLASRLPWLTRAAWFGAAAFLVTGVSLGAWFANDPVLGARLRLAHAEINLLGWSGLLVSGMAYYFAPRFAGAPLKWPRLAWAQIGTLAIGVTGGAIALGARGYGHGTEWLLWIAQIAIAAAFIVFAAIVGATFATRKSAHVQAVKIAPVRVTHRESRVASREH